MLDNPPRVVIDLPGVKNEVRKRAIPVKSGLVSRVRVSQFQTSPDLVTRVVLDLANGAHALRVDGERLAVSWATTRSRRFGGSTPAPPRQAGNKSKPASEITRS